jgi:hypothetical protein
MDRAGGQHMEGAIMPNGAEIESPRHIGSGTRGTGSNNKDGRISPLAGGLSRILSEARQIVRQSLDQSGEKA